MANMNAFFTSFLPKFGCPLNGFCLILGCFSFMFFIYCYLLRMWSKLDAVVKENEILLFVTFVVVAVLCELMNFVMIIFSLFMQFLSVNTFVCVCMFFYRVVSGWMQWNRYIYLFVDIFWLWLSVVFKKEIEKEFTNWALKYRDYVVNGKIQHLA